MAGTSRRSGQRKPDTDDLFPSAMQKAYAFSTVASMVFGDRSHRNIARSEMSDGLTFATSNDAAILRANWLAAQSRRAAFSRANGAHKNDALGRRPKFAALRRFCAGRFEKRERIAECLHVDAGVVDRLTDRAQQDEPRRAAAGALLIPPDRGNDRIGIERR
jgi:hypothetical protein